MAAKMIRVQFDLPNNLREHLEDHAQSTGQSLSAVVREAIMLDLAKIDKPVKAKRAGSKIVKDAKKR